MAKIKTQVTANAGEDVEKEEHSSIVGLCIFCVTVTQLLEGGESEIKYFPQPHNKFKCLGGSRHPIILQCSAHVLEIQTCVGTFFLQVGMKDAKDAG
ncbi:rCG65910 [Rattus norvegicus]|uniref:LRRGT00201 n=2 Tax=Rattus norvegicus TaxID=10116 RepID=A0A0G2JVI1_RAT|nr:LRRGT00201 [Rattus norvegicus]EDM03694.1 rCG65910 [Rattus norvegicus]